MNRLARTLTVASTLSLALVLSNCSSFDPTDLLDGIFAAQKKPLPGERKPLFPSGTPGVSQGLPPELVKGYQPPPVAEAVPGVQDVQAAPAPPPKPKAKPKPKVAATPPADQTRSPTGAVGTAASARSPAPAAQSSPWPDPPPTRQSAGPTGGQSIWPDPPAPTITR